MYTFEEYRMLLRELKTNGYEFVTFDEQPDGRSVLLRHDIDWSPQKAVKFATIEADEGITSTYLFLVSSPAYNPVTEHHRECIREINELGHDIGLHFSVHQYFDTDPIARDSGIQPPDDQIEAAVNRERDILAENIVDDSIQVVSFHNPPEWIFGKTFEGFVSTYESRFFDAIHYESDSVQRWRGDPPFSDGTPRKIQILTHPVLWGESAGDTVDRLREERDSMVSNYTEHLEKTFPQWSGYQGRE